MHQAKQQSHQIAYFVALHLAVELAEVVNTGEHNAQGDGKFDVGGFDFNDFEHTQGEGQAVPQRKGRYEHQKRFPVAPLVHAAQGQQKQNVVVALPIGDVPQAGFKPKRKISQAVGFSKPPK